MTAPTQANLDATPIFNYIKAFNISEMAKAEEIMHSAYGKDDVLKIAAQGAHEVLKKLFDILTVNMVQAHNGAFDFKEETNILLKGINDRDPYMIARLQLFTPSQTEPAVLPPEGAAQ